MLIYFATYSTLPEGADDDILLAEHLKSSGHQVQFKIWNDPQVNWSLSDLTLIRSTWDYQKHTSDYLNWCRYIQTQTRLFNSYEVIHWNYSKSYLKLLELNSCKIVPTIFTNTAEIAVAEAAKALSQYKKIVLKPTVSASSQLTFNIQHHEEITTAVKAILERSELMLQPFIESVLTDGELSLIYFKHKNYLKFSHAVKKTPLKGDFRVQAEFGGHTTEHLAAPRLIEFGIKALAIVPASFLYARVDIVDWLTQPLIGEIELIEPSLYLSYSEKAAENAADALLSFF